MKLLSKTEANTKLYRKSFLITKTLMITGVSVALLSAIGCTRTVSHGITPDGHVERSNLVFPPIDKAWQKEGQFPNVENLSKIKPGIKKDELYYLIGRPHFSEAQHAREWDYIMKFYQADNSVKTCQYKIIFDKEYRGREFYWYPNDCVNYAKPEPRQVIQQIVQQAPASSKPNVRTEKITLDADALFRFDESNLNNMLPQGRAQLDNLAQKLIEYGNKGVVTIHLTGHTDYKGSQDYNYELSQRRANTVLGYLAQQGINTAIMTATGVGEDFPLVQCPTNLSQQDEIRCLQPNRRVEADIVITQYD